MELDADRIRKNVRKLGKALKQAAKQPSPDKIHDLRTHARGFEATLEALSLDSKRNERRLLRRVGDIRKRAGKVRDLDVHTAHLSMLHIKEEERDCGVQLFEYLGAARYKRAARFVALMRKYRTVIRKRLKRTSSRIEKFLDQNDQSSSQSEAVKNAIASALSLTSELATPANLNRGNLHPFRLKIKELHYVLQMMNNSGQEKFADVLVKSKDAIGEWHDWEELIALAKKVLTHEPNCLLLCELRAISERNYELALSITNKMRKHYLRSPDGSAKRSPRGKNGPGRPALKVLPTIAA
jgi:CHAD domain-containing protein